jgi:hypothetical protein
LLKAISSGVPISSACTIAGIANSTLAEWRAEYPEINNRIELARERMRETLLARVKLAAEDDWRASVELLKLSFASDYRRVVQPKQTNQHLHVHGDSYVLSPEKQAELREQRRRILATTKGAHVLAGNQPEQQPEQEQPTTYKIKRQSLLAQGAQEQPEEPLQEDEQEQESWREHLQEQEPESQPEQQPEPEPGWVANWHKAANEARRQEADEASEAWDRLGLR